MIFMSMGGKEAFFLFVKKDEDLLKEVWLCLRRRIKKIKRESKKICFLSKKEYLIDGEKKRRERNR